MRFCSLKTYLSTLRQLISFHPTIFGCEFVLGIFSATWTFIHRYIVSHVCLSWVLSHPCLLRPIRWGSLSAGGALLWHYLLFQVRLLLLDPSFSNPPYGFDDTYQLFWGWIWVTSFLYSFAVYDGIYSWFEFFRVCLSACWTDCAPFHIRSVTGHCSCPIFRTQGVALSTSLCPLLTT